MVKAKERRKEKWDIPNVRIEGKELVSIIKDLSTQGDLEVIAETSLNVFEGIEDIETNIELFQGDVEINVGPIRIDLSSGYKRGIWIRYNFINPDRSVAEILAERFRNRIAPYKVYLSHGKIVSSSGFLISALFSYYLVLPVLVDLFSESMSLTLFIVSVILYWFLASLALNYIFKDKGAVYYLARDSFWSRNRDRIILGLILLFLGAALGQLSERIDFIGWRE